MGKNLIIVKKKGSLFDNIEVEEAICEMLEENGSIKLCRSIEDFINYRHKLLTIIDRKIIQIKRRNVR